MGTGKVTFAGVQPFRGDVVWIDHGGGLVTGCFHMGAGLLVKAGDIVSPRTQLGKMRDTGHALGSHLHFQVEKDGTLINPEPFMALHDAPCPLNRTDCDEVCF